MRERYNIMLDPDRVKVIDGIRGLVSRSSYLNKMLGDEIERVNGVKQIINKKEVVENIKVVDQQQVIKIEIERLIVSLKNHHYSISEIRKFIKTSLVIINEECKGIGIQPLTLEELSEMLRYEADRKGIRYIQ